MAVFKSQAELLDESGQAIGQGIAYLHLARGLQREQDSTGTISLREWRPTGAAPVRLRLSDGRLLALSVSADAISQCSRNRVLRFQTHWLPADA